ncbi:MAG: hypothetical protein K5929_03455 [Lachnospiraceae bacterium]|nr:hypothetical protein [Lachnospiraceae bacterium]
MENEHNIIVYDEDESEIDLKDLVIQVMKHWRRMLVFAILFAMLLGGFRCYKAYISYQADKLEEKEKRENSFELWQYENTKKKLEENISRIDEKIEQIKEYESESILMNMDPYDYYLAYCRYYVTTNYQINPELGFQDKDYTDSVVMAYSSKVVDNALYDEIRSILGTGADDRYMGEIFDFSVDTESDMITIQAVGRTEAEAGKVLDAVSKKMQSSSDAISRDIHEHEIKLITEKNEHINYDDTNNDSTIKVKELQDTDKDLYLELNDELLQNQEQLVELEKNRPIVEFNISGVVKYAILGFAVGILIVMMWYAAFYVIGGSVKTEEDLTKSLNLRVLGRFNKPFGKNWFIDKKLRHMEGVNEFNNTPEKALKLAAANINALTDQNDKIIIVGTIPEEELKEACKVLSKGAVAKLEYGGNVLASATAVNNLSNSDKVVIVERLRMSQRVDISREVEALKNLGKEILGVVLA